MIHLGEHSAGAHVRIGEDVGNGMHRAERHATAKKTRQLFLAPRSRPRTDRAVDELLVTRARHLELSARILDQILAPHDASKCYPKPIVRACNRHPTVTRLIEPKRAEERMGTPLRLRYESGKRVLINDALAQRKNRVIHCDVDKLSFAGDTG